MPRRKKRRRPVRPGDRAPLAALRSRVRDVLQAAASAQGRLRLYFVTLTFASSELTTWDGDPAGSWVLSCADTFAARIASEDAPTTGALLSLDLSPRTLRPHFHGLVLTSRSDLEVDQLWGLLGRHCPDASALKLRVQPVTSSGTAHPWLRLYEDTHPLLVQVSNSLQYACKLLPGGVDLALRDRVVASGPFAVGVEWDLSLDERVCIACGDELPAGSRRHRTTCGRACRVALHRARKGPA